MASYKLIVIEQAASELEDACKYYNGKVVGLGFEFEDEVFSVFELIKNNPFLFPIKFAHIHEAVIRRFPFVITYEIVEKQILILAIFQTQQNPFKKTKKKRK